MSDIKKGDRVKVTVEGEYDPEELGFYLNGRTSWVNNKAVTFIEKIEPPVEVFKPGDVVRQKAGYRHVYLIRPGGGFTNLTNRGREYDYSFAFTSDQYERVDLSALTG